MRRRWVFFLLLIGMTFAQQPPPQPPPDLFSRTTPDGPPPQEPAKAPLVYTGKPLKLDVACSDDDIAAFGLTCSPEDPCPVFLELSGVEVLPGDRIFLTGNLHSETVTMWSVLLTSPDGGKSWTEPLERMKSTGLEQIQFLDLEYGWISGQQLLSLPRDPFILRTTDGGKSWRKRPLSSEPRVGAVETFHFETRTEGQLIVDRTQTGDSGARHELYETNTGGDTWSLREISAKPLKLRRPRVPIAGWRLRADGRTKTFNLEKQAGPRWQLITSFLIETGECKPAESKLEEPPTPSEEATGVLVVPQSKGSRQPPTLKKKKR
ncbi:MAG: hypothetical protein NZV14_12635 [Bryobacteraceae bacterium]|nr:hypothetical protein [Bryobacteraceae bacterium]MDW8379001.1 hypothetical protein [Bryobacterales bacterium]